MSRLAACLLLVCLTGCYNYGYRDQWRILLYGEDPAEDLQRVRTGRDSRDRREAMLRLVRREAEMSSEERERLSCRSVLRYMTSTLHEPSEVVRAMAAASLRQVGTREDVPLLTRSLKGDAALDLGPEPSPVVRREVVRTLSVLGAPADIQTLEEVLRRDKDAETRVEAAFALARFGTRAAVEPLLAGLDDQDAGVVFAAYLGLVRVTGAKVRPSALEWRRWWQEHKDGPVPVPPEEAESPGADEAPAGAKRPVVGPAAG